MLLGLKALLESIEDYGINSRRSNLWSRVFVAGKEFV
jgi:hypothetical protein